MPFAAREHARRYDATHRRLRAQWKLLVGAGLVDCVRCGLRIQPGEPWDLGHNDFDSAQWAGPEHRSCNRATNGRRRASREW